MEDREQNQALNESVKSNRTALIAALVIMFLIVGIVAAVVFIFPSGDDVSATDISDNDSTVSIADVSETNSDEASGTDTPSTPDIPDVSDVSESSQDTQSIDESSKEESKAPEVSEDNSEFEGWIINDMGYTFVYQNMGFQQFTYSKTDYAKRYANAISGVAAEFGEGVNVYSMLVPTHVEFVKDSLSASKREALNFYNSSQNKFINNVADALAGVTNVGIYDTLANHNDEYLYFNTDINWTSLAAYYAYQDYAATAGITDALDITKCTTGNIATFLGRFYNAVSAGSDRDSEKATDQLYANKDYIDYFMIPGYNDVNVVLRDGGAVYKIYALVGNNVTSSNGYSTFLGREGEHFEITTGNKNGKTLVVVGDTSVPTMLQYLVNDYQTIHYLNINYYTGCLSDFVAEKGATDVLFMSYCTNAVGPDTPEAISAMGKSDE